MRKWLYILIIVFFISCEEKVDMDIIPLVNNYLIVEGILTDEYKKQEIKLSKPVSSIGARPEMATGATVVVYMDEIAYPFTETEPGKYMSDSFAVSLRKEYNLSISYEGNEYSSSASSDPVTSFSPLTYYSSVNYDSLFLIFGNFSSQEDAMWEIKIDWSQVPGYENVANKALLYFFTIHTVDIAEVFAPEYKHVYFPSKTVIIQKKYSLTEEHAAFYRTLLSETDWRGGFFDVAPANLPTNMSEGALGYFGVCSVISDTILVE